MVTIITTHTAYQTMQLGMVFAAFMTPGTTLALEGDLGVGKTTFTKGLASGLGVEEAVTSPTFTIVKIYPSGRLPLYHVDAYRLEGNEDDIGLDELIQGNGVCVVEWPQYITELIPNDAISLKWDRVSDNVRTIYIEANDEKAQAIIRKVEALWNEHYISIPPQNI
jgi:tRNA threonylcarbamoyladenosine biosynthesis protein TsaE